MSDTTNPNIFPLDEFDPTAGKKKGKKSGQAPVVNNQVSAGQQPDDPLLFPLDEFQIAQPASSAPKRKTTSKAKTTTSGSVGIKNHNPIPPSPSQPNSGPSRPQPQQNSKSSGNSGCGGCLVWILLIIGLIYFRDNIRQTKIYNDHFKPVVGKYFDGIEQWVKENNPLVSQKSAFEKFRKTNPVINLEETDERVYTLNRRDTFSTQSIILTGKTGNSRYHHVLAKGTKKIKFRQSVKNKILKKDTPIKMIQDIDSLLESNGDLKQRILVQEWTGGPLFYVTVNDLTYYKEIELSFLPDDYAAFESKEEGSIFISEFIYERLKDGVSINSLDLSSIPVKKYTVQNSPEPVAENLIELADKQYSDKAYESAKLTYDKILKNSPFNQEALLGRANTLLMMNKFDLALKDYNVIISLSAQKINDEQFNQTITQAILYRGVTEYFRGNYDRAMNDLDIIIDKGSSNPDAYLYRGLCKKQQGIDDNGCSDFSKALELGRKDAAEFICND